MDHNRAPDAGPATVAAAWAVHLFTASGGFWGLLALIEISHGRYRNALLWMALALAVDAVDGGLARLVRVRTVLPSLDGALLDNLVDFLNYVIVPAYLLLHARLLPEPTALPAAFLICIASAFQFSHVEAKSRDHLFRGFPSYWNLVVFYLLLLRPHPAIGLGIVVVLVLLVFAPVYFVYPSRTPQFRRWTVCLGFLWAVCMLVLLGQYPDPDPWWIAGSMIFVLYYLVLSGWLTWRRLYSGP